MHDDAASTPLVSYKLINDSGDSCINVSYAHKLQVAMKFTTTETLILIPTHL